MTNSSHPANDGHRAHPDSPSLGADWTAITGERSAPVLGPSLKARALRMLARRDYSQAELQRKLAAHATSDGELQDLLNLLSTRGLQSDARVTESVVRQRAERYGTARIAQELRRRGVSAEESADELNQLKASELERAQALWRHQFGQAPTDANGYARQLRYLVSRGFSADAVHKVLRVAKSDPDPDPDFV